MPVFISYSHRDRDFATQLAAQLVKRHARVWIDQWELHVGDSLIDRIQNALQGARALIVVLSKASVASEWCKKEWSSGLLRELEEKRVVVLPVLLDDCEIPLFLRGKRYADFRTDFDSGLKEVLEAVGKVASETLGRVDQPEWHMDWAIDWGLGPKSFWMRVTLVEQAEDQPYSVLTEITMKANDKAVRRYRRFCDEGIGWIERATILDMLAERTKDRDLRLLLEDERAKMLNITLSDPKLGTAYAVKVVSRRLGTDTGRDILLDIAGQLQCIREGQRQSLRPPTSEEAEKVARIQRERPRRPR